MLNIIKSDIDNLYMLVDIVEHDGLVISKKIMESKDIGEILAKIDEDAVPSNAVGQGQVAGLEGDVAVKRKSFLKYLRRKKPC